jgi:hypothetical protein
VSGFDVHSNIMVNNSPMCVVARYEMRRLGWTWDMGRGSKGFGRAYLSPTLGLNPLSSPLPALSSFNTTSAILRPPSPTLPLLSSFGVSLLCNGLVPVFHLFSRHPHESPFPQHRQRRLTEGPPRQHQPRPRDRTIFARCGHGINKHAPGLDTIV